VDEQAILFFVEPIEPSSSARAGDYTGPDPHAPKRKAAGQWQNQVEVPVKQIQQLVALVTTVFEQAENEVEQQRSDSLRSQRLQLQEIEVTVEVNGEGQLGILGFGGKGGGKGGIKLKFARK
jgi:hypothetical protein